MIRWLHLATVIAVPHFVYLGSRARWRVSGDCHTRRRPTF